ncbi:hypothetical protein [Cystobacter ferrugineus]|nr:hypothetical protein [Cystobacter ferrugineus]
MHMGLRIAALLVVGFLAWPSGALACSCEQQPNELHEALRSAREKAAAIFVGRVAAIEPVYQSPDSKRLRLHRVTFEDIEVLKGKVAPRQVVTTYRPDGIACGYLFEVGVEYLVYARADEPSGLETSMCSRTQPARRASVEIDSLRIGAPPLRPVALRRKRVSCTECDVFSVAPALVCGGAERCDSSGVREAAKALHEGRPFWALERRHGHGEIKAYGVALDGRMFELVQQPYFGAEEDCMQRVLRRWCERLSVEPDPQGWRPAVTCVGPASEEFVCDETTTRRSSWGPVESMLGARCDWDRADAPFCSLDEEPASSDPGGQATSPGLLCVPFMGPPRHRCWLVPDVAITPPDKADP